MRISLRAIAIRISPTGNLAAHRASRLRAISGPTGTPRAYGHPLAYGQSPRASRISLPPSRVLNPRISLSLGPFPTQFLVLHDGSDLLQCLNPGTREGQCFVSLFAHHLLLSCSHFPHLAPLHYEFQFLSSRLLSSYALCLPAALLSSPSSSCWLTLPSPTQISLLLGASFPVDWCLPSALCREWRAASHPLLLRILQPLLTEAWHWRYAPRTS